MKGVVASLSFVVASLEGDMSKANPCRGGRRRVVQQLLGPLLIGLIMSISGNSWLQSRRWALFFSDGHSQSTMTSRVQAVQRSRRPPQDKRRGDDNHWLAQESRGKGGKQGATSQRLQVEKSLSGGSRNGVHHLELLKPHAPLGQAIVLSEPNGPPSDNSEVSIKAKSRARTVDSIRFCRPSSFCYSWKLVPWYGFRSFLRLCWCNCHSSSSSLWDHKACAAAGGRRTLLTDTSYVGGNRQ